MSALEVNVVARDRGSPLARRVAAELLAAGQPMRFGDQPTLRGPQVLCDDESLPRATRRLVELLPGRLVFPGALLCVEDEARAGATLPDGFRDVVTPEEVPRAVDALLSAAPPVLLAKLRRDLEKRFVPELVATIRQRALDKHELLGRCADLLRASRYLEKRIFLLGRLRDRQALDDVYAFQGKIERFLDDLGDLRRPRLHRLPRFPELKIRKSTLGKHEPRLPRSRDDVEEALAWMREAGLLAALGKEAESELKEAGAHLADKPLEALRAMLRIVERQVTDRIAEVERIKAAIDPLDGLAEDCLERYGVGLVAPAIALPDQLRQALRGGLEPPPDVYLAYCLDLRDLRCKRGSEVLDEILAHAPEEAS